MNGSEDLRPGLKNLPQATLSFIGGAENGSGTDSITFIFHESTLVVLGDLGEAVFNLTEQACPRKISAYSLEYLVEKMGCSSSKYVYDKDAAFKELDEFIEGMLAYIKDTPHLDAVAVRAQREELHDISENLKERFSLSCGFVNTASGEFVEKLLGYDSDALEWLDSAGQHISPHVVYWHVALQMAYEQLSAENEPFV